MNDARANSGHQGGVQETDKVSLPRARSIERQERLRERAQAAPRRMARSFVQLPQKVNPMILLAAAVIVVFLAVSISTPLRNYFEQRAELAQLNAQIAQQESEKQRLTEELGRYTNEDYLKEQARTRLGLIEPGESAFRIFSPNIHADAPGAAPGVEENLEPLGDWYQQLWDSISVPEEPATPPNATPGDHDLPTLPDPNAPKPQGEQNNQPQGGTQGGAQGGAQNPPQG